MEIQELRDLIDAVEERAAIIEDGEKCRRETAENCAARLHGFADWSAYRAHVRAVQAKAMK